MLTWLGLAISFLGSLIAFDLSLEIFDPPASSVIGAVFSVVFLLIAAALNIIGAAMIAVFGLIGRLRYLWMMLLVVGTAGLISFFGLWVLLTRGDVPFSLPLTFSAPGLITIVIAILIHGRLRS